MATSLWGLTHQEGDGTGACDFPVMCEEAYYGRRVGKEQINTVVSGKALRFECYFIALTIPSSAQLENRCPRIFGMESSCTDSSRNGKGLLSCFRVFEACSTHVMPGYVLHAYRSDDTFQGDPFHFVVLGSHCMRMYSARIVQHGHGMERTAVS